MRLILLAIVGFAVFQGTPSQADWPGLLGPNRDGKASNESRISENLVGTPSIVWELEASQGYAGASILGDQVCLFDRKRTEYIVRLVRINDGSEIWTTPIATRFVGGMDADKGPRCVPTITQDFIVLYSPGGEAYCLDRKTGKVLWKRSLLDEYQGDEGFFGVGSTPLVSANRVIVCVGGKKGGVVCLDVTNGKTLWQATKDEASYASPISLRGDLADIVVVTTRVNVVGLDQRDGKELWKIPFGKKSQSVVAATPLTMSDGSLFLTAAYDVGSLVAVPSRTELTVRRKGEVLSSQYATPVLVNGFLFGSDGREDFGNGSYKCIKEDDFQVMWEVKEMPICHSIAVGDKVLLAGVDGSLRVIAATSQAYQEQWKGMLPTGTYRAMPAYDGSILIMKSEKKWLAVRMGP